MLPIESVGENWAVAIFTPPLFATVNTSTLVRNPKANILPRVFLAEAVAELRAGKFVVVLDDADRENEGDLIMLAEHASQQALAFLVEHSSGYVCIGMTGEALDRLHLPLQVRTPS